MQRCHQQKQTLASSIFRRHGLQQNDMELRSLAVSFPLPKRSAMLLTEVTAFSLNCLKHLSRSNMYRGFHKT